MPISLSLSFSRFSTIDISRLIVGIVVVQKRVDVALGESTFETLFSRVISRKFHSMANQRAKSNRTTTFLDTRRRLSRRFLLLNLVKSTDCVNCSLRITCVPRRVPKTSVPNDVSCWPSFRAIETSSFLKGGDD